MLFLAATAQYNLPAGLLSAECYVESHHKTNAVNLDDGKGGPSMGICQIKLGTALQVGFKGTAKQLMQPENNIHYAAAYLAKQIKRYHGNLPKAIGAYNSGTFFLSKKGTPVNSIYIRKVLHSWEAGK